MIEQKMRSALPLLAGLVLASGAWGQSVTMTQDNGGMVNVARELFGSPDGREVVFERDLSDFDGASQPYISLTISGPDSAAMLAANNTTRIVFTLNGATFASSASGSDLRYFQGANLESGISVKVVAGGSRGDRSVTFEVETTADITNVDDGTADVLYFFPPNLTVTPVLFNPREQMPALQNWGATVVASIDPREATVASNPFPRGVLGSWDHDEDVNTPARVGAVADGQIVKLDFALGASLGMPPVGGHFANVDLMDRKKFASGVNDGGMEVTLSGGGKTRGLKVGDLSITLVPEANAPRVLRSSAKTVDSGGRLNSALGGTADVAVTGPFKEGDMVLLGADQTSDGSKSFNVASGGPATVSIPIEATAAPMAVVYVPGGTMDLRPGRFNASLALDFNDALAASGGYGASSGEIKYKGIELGAYAYGIVRGGGIERSFVRIGCMPPLPIGVGECSVFLDCTAQDGTPYFGEISRVPVGATSVFNSDHIAEALDGAWDAGRGRCDILSNGRLEVQHMVRSGGIQVNNTVVIGSDGILDK